MIKFGVIYCQKNYKYGMLKVLQQEQKKVSEHFILLKI